MKKKFIDEILVFWTGIGIGMLWNKCKKKNKASDKYFLYYDVLNRWMKQKEKGISIADKLKQREIKEIAIYGLGDMGKHLQKELINTGINVKYAIDKSVFAVVDLDVYFPESDLPQVDAIIVTPIFDYNNICSCLKKKMSCQILSIEDLV